MNCDCIQKDDGNKLINEVLNSNFFSSCYASLLFWSLTQLKGYYAKNGSITRKHLKVV